MKIAAVIIAVFSVMNTACADDVPHFLTPGTTAKQPVSPSVLNQRIELAATKYASYGPLPRIAFYDIAFPADANEYNALGGYAVALITILSQKAEELPPKRIYAKLGAEAVELRLISAIAPNTASPRPVTDMFGENRWNGFYLFPVYLKRDAQSLIIDFAKNREGFILAKFSSDDLQDIEELPVAKPTTSRPNNDAVAELIAREFPGFQK